jgi:hypothetical protein
MPAHPVTKVLDVRDCGYDEAWLRDQIADNPNILGLGDLELLGKEKTHSEHGRLDLLLGDREDEIMYEVELQLGEADESHIIRTIEYWDREKRRRPSWRHIAVLVAKKINNRFFNVVQLLSKAVPIIGIQANMVQIGESRALHFTTIMNSSEEEEDVEEGPQVAEKDWRDNYLAAHECALWYRELLARVYGDTRVPPPRFTKGYITLYLDGKLRVAVTPRKNDRAAITVEKLDKETLDEADANVNKERTVFTPKGNMMLFIGNLQQLKETHAAHEWLAKRLGPDPLKT